MGKLIIHQHLVNEENAKTLAEICPFGAISYQDGKLDISSACKMCKMCVRKGQGLVDFVEEVTEIDKSLWKGICVYADCTGGTIHRVTFELIGKAKELAAVTGHPVYVLAIGRDAEFYRLAEMIGRPDLATDPRCLTHSVRTQNRELVDTALNTWAADKTVEAVCAALQEIGVPCGPVMDVPQVISDPHIRDHRNMFPSYDQPKAGKVTVTNIPVKIPGIEEVPLQPAPELGEHTHAVLQELLGMDAETLSRLEENGVI